MATGYGGEGVSYIGGLTAVSIEVKKLFLLGESLKASEASISLRLGFS